MNAPVVWIVIPAFVSLFLYLIKDQKSRAIMYIASSAVFILLAMIIKINSFESGTNFTGQVSSTMNILGRSLVLNENDKFIIQLTYLINVVWGIAIFILKKKSLITPLGMIFSSFLLTAVSVEPFLYSAMIIEIAVILSIPLVANFKSDETNGIIRYLIYQTMAMPFILFAGWYLAGGEINPINADQLIQATVLLGLGFVFWLAVFPFHSWVPMVFKETDPINSGFILLLLQTFSFILIIKYINGFAWLRNYEVFFQALRFLGIIMIVFSAINLVFQKNIRKMIGYEFLHSSGVILVSIGISNSRGIELFSFLIGSRLLIFPLLFFSVSLLIKYEQELSISNFGELVKEHPVAGSAFIFSMLALVGMPLTIGFPLLQALYQFLADDYTFILILFLFGIGLNTIFVLKLIEKILKNGINFRGFINNNNQSIFIIVLLIILFINGLFPKFILTQFSKLISGFEFLIN